MRQEVGPSLVQMSSVEGTACGHARRPFRTGTNMVFVVPWRDRSTDENAHPIAAVGGLTPTWDDQGQSRGVQTQGVVVAT